MEMMKERFSKLLLGKDMPGSAKGVCTVLAISNAIAIFVSQVPLDHEASTQHDDVFVKDVITSETNHVPSNQPGKRNRYYVLSSCFSVIHNVVCMKLLGV